MKTMSVFFRSPSGGSLIIIRSLWSSQSTIVALGSYAAAASAKQEVFLVFREGPIRQLPAISRVARAVSDAWFYRCGTWPTSTIFSVITLPSNFAPTGTVRCTLYDPDYYRNLYSPVDVGDVGYICKVCKYIPHRRCSRGVIEGKYH